MSERTLERARHIPLLSHHVGGGGTKTNVVVDKYTMCESLLQYNHGPTAGPPAEATACHVPPTLASPPPSAGATACFVCPHRRLLQESLPSPRQLRQRLAAPSVPPLCHLLGPIKQIALSEGGQTRPVFLCQVDSAEAGEGIQTCYGRQWRQWSQ